MLVDCMVTTYYYATNRRLVEFVPQSESDLIMLKGVYAFWNDEIIGPKMYKKIAHLVKECVNKSTPEWKEMWKNIINAT